MAKSRSEITKQSDESRSVVSKSYKLHTSIVQEIKSLSEELQITQGELIAEALKLYKEHAKKPD